MTRKKKASEETDGQRGHASQKGGVDRRLGEQHGQCAGLDLEKAGSGHGRRHRDEADRGEGDAGDRQSPGKLAERQQPGVMRSEEHTSELQSLMRIYYAVVSQNKKK